MGANDPEELRRYLVTRGGLIDADKVFVYRTMAGGRPSMTVLYGSYPSRRDAARALAQLPQQLQQGQPYLRSVGGIRAELGQARPTAQ